MARHRRTPLHKAALVVELRETEGRSEKEISDMTGVPASTVHTILSRAHGWGDITTGEVFRRHRQEQNKALEQTYRTMAAESLITAWNKMDEASFAQLIFASGIMTDKARLLAGESTQNISVHETVELAGIDELCGKLSQALLTKAPESKIDNGGDEGSGNQGSGPVSKG